MKIENPFSLDGKSALVAGASRGIGLAIARQVAAAGARTHAGRSIAGPAREARRRIARAGLLAEALPLDVADPESVTGLAARPGQWIS